MSLIELKNVSKIYQTGKHTLAALKNINLTLYQDEFTAIIGKSAAGKSTLMNIIGLLDPVSTGQYFLEGQDISCLRDKALAHIRSQKIGFIFQSFYLLPRLNALQNVALPLIYRDIPFKTAEEMALNMLKKVDIAEFSLHKPHELSGGQQQRVAIARALINRPSLILADEPTGSLDSKTEKDVMRLFTELNRTEKATIIIITHNPEIAKQCARSITLSDGEITGDSRQ